MFWLRMECPSDCSERVLRLGEGKAPKRIIYGELPAEPFASESGLRYHLAHDLFKSWAKLKRGAPYDLIVIDPPSNQGPRL